MKVNLKIQRIPGLPPVVWVGRPYLAKFRELMLRYKLYAEESISRAEFKFTFLHSFPEVERLLTEFNALNSAAQLSKDSKLT
jgi:hypothetical protein